MYKDGLLAAYMPVLEADCQSRSLLEHLQPSCMHLQKAGMQFLVSVLFRSSNTGLHVSVRCVQQYGEKEGVSVAGVSSHVSCRS
jgi:hypothetical protein